MNRIDINADLADINADLAYWGMSDEDARNFAPVVLASIRDAWLSNPVARAGDWFVTRTGDEEPYALHIRVWGFNFSSEKSHFLA